MEQVSNEILQQLIPLLGSLQWAYILSYVLVVYGVNQLGAQIQIPFLKSLKKRFKVAIIGLLYGVVYFLLNDMSKEQIDNLFLSYLITFALHKLLVETFIGWLEWLVGWLKVKEEAKEETQLKVVKGLKDE